ncbi:hypothetical protein BJ165DRAFT_1056543 [Panaeolus papilionaceus]|nr:hypothetical protein BJ165DRAFT_1056543 [Panaeolus papilionaceus]
MRVGRHQSQPQAHCMCVMKLHPALVVPPCQSSFGAPTHIPVHPLPMPPRQTPTRLRAKSKVAPALRPPPACIRHTSSPPAVCSIRLPLCIPTGAHHPHPLLPYLLRRRPKRSWRGKRNGRRSSLRVLVDWRHGPPWEMTREKI